MDINDPKLYTTKEIADIYRVKPGTITRQWIKDGLRYKAGERKGYVYRIAWVEEYIEKASKVETRNEQIEVRIKKNNKNRNSGKRIQYVV